MQAEDYLPAREEAQLFQHLYEINQQWAHQPERFLIADALLTFPADEARIQLHLQLVEGFLRQRQPEQFNDAQLARRRHHLNVLKAYWQAAIFPKNTGHPNRQPYFVDFLGTACAVGHLLREDGQQALVNRVVREHNYSYLAQMPYPELQVWADANGFTLAELAWIQPGYAYYTFDALGNNGGVDGVVNAMISSLDDQVLYVAGSFSEIDGLSTANIAQWDGESWNTLNGGVNGEIHVMDVDGDGNLYIGGEFELVDIPGEFNIAKWNGETWEGFQNNKADGVIYSLKYTNSTLYVGGEFDEIGEIAVANLAYYRSWLGWQTFGYAEGQQLQDLFSCNGPVYALEIVNDQLLVGGNFDETASLINTSTTQKMAAENLAYWAIRESRWLGTLTGGNAPVNCLKYYEGAVHFGGNLNEEQSFGSVTGGLWNYFDPSYVRPYNEGIIHRFFSGTSDLFVVGGFEFTDVMFLFYDVRSLAIVNGRYLEAVANIEGDVRAGTTFRGKDIVAGSFTEIHGQPINDIAVVRSIFSSANEPISEDQLQVYHNGEGLSINYELDASEAQFQLYNMLGQLVSSTLLSERIGQQTLSTHQLASGAYVYQVVAGERRQSGKISIVQN